MARDKENRQKNCSTSDEYCLVNEIEPWMQEEIPADFADNGFFRIVLFYVLHSPCKKGSYSRTDLGWYQWKNPWYSERFKELLDSTARFDETTFLHCDSKAGFRGTWLGSKFNDSFWYNRDIEFAVFSYAGESNPHLDLLHHIRNSLAHGRFTAKKIKMTSDYMVYFEDVDEVSETYRVTARIALKKSTLTQWIDIFECKTEAAKEVCQDLLKKNSKNGKRSATPASTSSRPTRRS